MDIKTLQNILKANSPEDFKAKTLDVLRLELEETILFLVDTNKYTVTGHKKFKSHDDLIYYIARLPMTIGYACFYIKESVHQSAASFYHQGWTYQYANQKTFIISYYDNETRSTDDVEPFKYDDIFCSMDDDTTKAVA